MSAKKKPAAKKPAAKGKGGAPRKIDELREVEVTPARGEREAEIRTMTCGEHICWLIETFGLYLVDASAIAGVSESIVYRWRARGEEWIEAAEEAEEAVEIPEGEVVFVEFCQSLKKARGEAVVFHLKNIKRHAVLDWKASAWYLERTAPDRYSRRTRHEVTGEDGGPVKHEVHVPDTDEWNERVTEVAAEARRRKEA